MLIDMGYDVEVPPEWNDMVKVLRSRPGSSKNLHSFTKNKEVYPALHCAQEIP